VAKIHHFVIKEKVASNMVKEFFWKFSKKNPCILRKKVMNSSRFLKDLGKF
jgi:hypothetical protein